MSCWWIVVARWVGRTGNRCWDRRWVILPRAFTLLKSFLSTDHQVIEWILFGSSRRLLSRRNGNRCRDRRNGSWYGKWKGVWNRNGPWRRLHWLGPEPATRRPQPVPNLPKVIGNLLVGGVLCRSLKIESARVDPVGRSVRNVTKEVRIPRAEPLRIEADKPPHHRAIRPPYVTRCDRRARSPGRHC
jgi:hypothetical protein